MKKISDGGSSDLILVGIRYYIVYNRHSTIQNLPYFGLQINNSFNKQHLQRVQQQSRSPENQFVDLHRLTKHIKKGAHDKNLSTLKFCFNSELENHFLCQFSVTSTPALSLSPARIIFKLSQSRFTSRSTAIYSTTCNRFQASGSIVSEHFKQKLLMTKKSSERQVFNQHIKNKFSTTRKSSKRQVSTQQQPSHRKLNRMTLSHPQSVKNDDCFKLPEKTQEISLEYLAISNITFIMESNQTHIKQAQRRHPSTCAQQLQKIYICKTRCIFNKSPSWIESTSIELNNHKRQYPRQKKANMLAPKKTVLTRTAPWDGFPLSITPAKDGTVRGMTMLYRWPHSELKNCKTENAESESINRQHRNLMKDRTHLSIISINTKILTGRQDSNITFKPTNKWCEQQLTSARLLATPIVLEEQGRSDASSFKLKLHKLAHSHDSQYIFGHGEFLLQSCTLANDRNSRRRTVGTTYCQTTHWRTRTRPPRHSLDFDLPSKTANSKFRGRVCTCYAIATRKALLVLEQKLFRCKRYWHQTPEALHIFKNRVITYHSMATVSTDTRNVQSSAAIFQDKRQVAILSRKSQMPPPTAQDVLFTNKSHSTIYFQLSSRSLRHFTQCSTVYRISTSLLLTPYRQQCSMLNALQHHGLQGLYKHWYNHMKSTPDIVDC